MLTSREIREKNFGKNSMGGIKAEEIDTYLLEIANNFEALESKNNELYEKIEVLADKINEYRDNESVLMTAIFNAQKTADGILRDADTAAKEKLDYAAKEAERMLTDAKEKSFKMVNEADKKTKDVLSIGEDKIKKQVAHYNFLVNQITNYKTKILAIYKAQIESIADSKVDDDKVNDFIEKMNNSEV